MVAEWDSRFGRKPRAEERHRSGLGLLDAQPVRTCSNGEALPMLNKTEIAKEAPSIEARRKKTPDVMRGGADSGFSMRGVGAEDVGGDPLER